MKNVLILGGPGNISESTIRYFLEKKVPVGVLTHATTDLLGLDGKISVFRGDRNDIEDLMRVYREFDPEVIIDFCCFEPFQAKVAVEAVKQMRCARYIFVSTVDVYGYPLNRLPMRESDPWGEPNCLYAKNKKECEQIFKEGFADTSISLTIARPAYSMGKTFALSAFERNRGKHIVARIREGNPVYVPGDGNALLQTGSAYNTGLMIARIAENDNCKDQDYTCGHDRFNTQDEYIKAFANVLGMPVRIVHIPTDFMYSLERKEVEDSILKDLSIHNIYFSVDKFKQEFPDFVWEYSMEDAARAFIEHQDKIGTFDKPLEEQFEDKVLEKWEKAMEALRQEIDF